MNDSLVSSAFRSFLKAFFGILGLLLGLLLILLLFSSLMSKSESEPESKYSVEILPNADGTRKALTKDAPVILQVDLVGVIGVDELTADKIRRLLVESREGSLKKDRVKAVLLRIETPGGTAIDADGIYHALMEYKKQHNVPIYAYVDGMCASGGMYAAVAANKIYASSASLVGSVGVITPPLFNVSQVLDKFNIKSLTLYAGKEKDELNPFRPWKPDEQAHMQNLIDYYYTEFVDIVTQNRPNLNKEKLINEYGAKVFPAPQAKELGYIDNGHAGYNETLQLLLKEIGIDDNYYQIVRLTNNDWFSTLFNSQSPLFSGKMKHEFLFSPEFNPAFANKALYLYTTN
jgi:protease IV